MSTAFHPTQTLSLLFGTVVTIAGAIYYNSLEYKLKHAAKSNSNVILPTNNNHTQPASN